MIRTKPHSKTIVLGSFLITVVLATLGCDHSEVRMDASGTVSVNGLPVQSGTLVLTPTATGQMPVASRIEAGHFRFDMQTGPVPGEYIARVNRDEATIEEISAAAAQNPRGAAKQFNVNRTSFITSDTASGPEAAVVISTLPEQKVTIELKKF